MIAYQGNVILEPFPVSRSDIAKPVVSYLSLCPNSSLSKIVKISALQFLFVFLYIFSFNGILNSVVYLLPKRLCRRTVVEQSKS